MAGCAHPGLQVLHVLGNTACLIAGKLDREAESNLDPYTSFRSPLIQRKIAHAGLSQDPSTHGTWLHTQAIGVLLMDRDMEPQDP
ncbi:hypothetical protein CROQUDRAFT_88520 [Cronartium quercuum f. sp. fusiforme G11]|uniref:Uncharacterized protein n=1 Tax=Cronartium quercuum f. sp. fusiforme G11 TaxID=708437 RepID=A0A9P6NTA6_9BASI|nr:hypothetical protein CROQUDRAFT_88520 [Cronartium quercuum f. sp. fusiforme G11]